MPSMYQRSLFYLCCLVSVLSVAAQLKEEDFLTCDTGPDAFAFYGKNIPQTCIDVPSDDGSTERCFYTYVPESCSSSSPEEIIKAPLVVDVHGLGSCAVLTSLYTGWMQKAEEECIVIVWPSGNPNDFVGSCFTAPGFLQSSEITGAEDGVNEVSTAPCCCLSMDLLPSNESIDPLFVKMAIDATVESLAADDESPSVVDTDRIYMAGHSNGCMMSLTMAALYSDTIAAVCCHAGFVVTPFAEDYSPVPIMMIHGTEDEDVPPQGATLLTLPGIGDIGLLSIDQTMSYLNDKNECSESEELDLVDETGVVGTVSKKSKCKNGASVEIVLLTDVGHMPYKYDSPMSETDVDTTSLAWEFCSAHSKVGPIEAEEIAKEPQEQQQDEEVEEEPELDTDEGADEGADESSACHYCYGTKSFSTVFLLALSFFLGVVHAM